MTLWGERGRMHIQNTEQLHAHDHYQNVTETQETEYDTKVLQF